jgi:phospholipid/cholesterol/gamma-HCH transport system ATP-binding protein
MGTQLELELRSLRSVRGGYEAIRDISLGLSLGETLFLMGTAGSGKSILLKTAAGISLPDEGEVLFRGRSLARMSPREEAAFRKASGFAFQDAALWANQSLYDNLALPVRLHQPRWSAAEVERAVLRAAELVGWDQDLHARPAELSTGERKLIGLARALVLDPELLFLDDPTSGLDETSAARVFDIVSSLKSRGRSIVVSSAVSELASRCADRVAVLIGGKLAACGPYDEAVSWSDPALRAVTGRLKARAVVPEWAGGLAGAWASAFVEDSSPLPDAETPAKPRRNTLGDIINDVEGASGGPDLEKRDES